MTVSRLPNPRIFFVAAGLILCACTSYTGTAQNPVERSLTWFSYVAGDDIRKACREGGRDHFRFVYNAVYEKQIRTYEVRGVEGGAQYMARARNESGQVSRFQLSDPLGPWELSRADATLTNEQAAAIIDAFSMDAAGAPDPAGRQVASNEFYWIVSACNAGRFRVWLFDQYKVNLPGLAFVPELARYDETGIPFRAVEPVEGFGDNVFYIKINATADGIVR